MIVVAGCAAALAGCAGTSATMNDAFVDPSSYDYYDCKQLASERTSLTQRIAENQRLMDKARTGVAGGAVAAVAYGNEDISLNGKLQLVNRMWQKNRCDQQPVAAPAR